MANIFNDVQIEKYRHNTFNLSHDRKFSFKMGQLVPILAEEVLPGDKWMGSNSQLVRFAPLIAPMMHKVDIYTHFFFVPNRLLWDNFETFITGGFDGDSSVSHPHPTIEWTPQSNEAMSEGGLGDYLGLPTYKGDGAGDATASVNALPFAAYHKIFEDYFLDENLGSFEEAWKLVDGTNPSNKLQNMKLRAWRKNYFTSALPWTQRGGEVAIPLGDYANIEFNTNSDSNWPPTLGGTNYYFRDSAGNLTSTVDGNASFDGGRLQTDATGHDSEIGPLPNHRVDLSTASAATINELRTAFRLQEWFEKSARGGNRYIENILMHFGVRSSDSRLQRAEFLGGSKQPLQVSEVLQTSASAFTDEAFDPTTPQGNMAGHGISFGNSSGWAMFAEEHGWIIGLMSVLPRADYFQGIPKKFSRMDQFDYAWPSFGHLGEQPIFTKELFFDDSVSDDEVFGYTPRYAEYKFINNSIHGEFRTTLDYWHMAEKFSSKPALNMQFINCDPSTRIFAVPDQDAENLYAHVYHSIKTKRLLPVFGTPRGI